MINRILLFLIVVLSFSSCLKELEVKFPDLAPMLTVNCLFNPDSAWSAQVTKSLGPLASDSIPVQVTNATVLLFTNGILIDTLRSQSEGLYKSDSIPRVGIEYRIEVTAPGFSPVSSTNRVPDPVSLASWSIQDSVFVTSWGEVQAGVKFTFNDPGMEKNYYKVVLYAPDTLEYLGDTFIYLNTIYYSSIDPLLVDYGAGAASFTDNLFNGESKTFTINFSSYDFSNYEDLYLQLNSLSRDRFRYEQTYYPHFMNQGNPFAEPTILHTNVEDGYGIFAGSSNDVVKIK